jgi:hypothetical protein
MMDSFQTLLSIQLASLQGGSSGGGIADRIDARRRSRVAAAEATAEAAGMAAVQEHDEEDEGEDEDENENDTGARDEERGRGVIENKHSTDLESTNRVRTSVWAFTLMAGLAHSDGKSSPIPVECLF